MNLSKPYSQSLKKLLHSDPNLGIGNFLFKVYEQLENTHSKLFILENTWISPDGISYDTLSHDELMTAVKSLAYYYLEIGINKGNIVVTYTQEGISQFLHCVALMSIGAIPAPVNCSMNPTIALRYFSKNNFDHFVYDQHDNTKDLEDQLTATKNIWDISKNTAKFESGSTSQWPVLFGNKDETVMICHSSGTTGVPKAVLFGHQQFFFGKRDRLLDFPSNDDERMITALPQSHSAGFSYLMTAVLLGIPTLVMQNIKNNKVVRQIDNFHPTIMVAFPQTYSALAEAFPDINSMPSLRHFFNTGDTAHKSHVSKLLSAAPEAHFHDGFGASELGMALCRLDHSKENEPTGIRSVGKPTPFAEVKILSKSLQELPPNEVGYICFRSKTITAGYYQNATLTARCKTPDNFWLTGDVGYIDQTGTVFHLDRAVDIIDTPAGHAYTLVLEELLLTELSLPEASVIGIALTPRTQQMITAFVQVAPSEDEQKQCEAVTDILDKYIFQELGRHVPICCVNIAPNSTVQVGATGKVLKRVLQEEFWPQHADFLAGDRSNFENIIIKNF